MIDKSYRPDDEYIWNNCMQGNISFFEILYRRYYVLLVEYGERICANKDIACDMAQNLFVKLISNHKSLSHTPYVKAYLFKAYRNLIIDHQRQKKEYFNCDNIDYEDNSIEKAMRLKENVEILKQVFIGLNVKQKEIIYLFFFKELSHQEIALILNINNQSSKNLLHKTITRSRKLFYNLYHGYDNL